MCFFRKMQLKGYCPHYFITKFLDVNFGCNLVGLDTCLLGWVREDFHVNPINHLNFGWLTETISKLDHLTLSTLSETLIVWELHLWWLSLVLLPRQWLSQKQIWLERVVVYHTQFQKLCISHPLDYRCCTIIHPNGIKPSKSFVVLN